MAATPRTTATAHNFFQTIKGVIDNATLIDTLSSRLAIYYHAFSKTKKGQAYYRQ
jgi:hypothetical protein